MRWVRGRVGKRRRERGEWEKERKIEKRKRKGEEGREREGGLDRGRYGFCYMYSGTYIYDLTQT